MFIFLIHYRYELLSAADSKQKQSKSLGNLLGMVSDMAVTFILVPTHNAKTVAKSSKCSIYPLCHRVIRLQMVAPAQQPQHKRR